MTPKTNDHRSKSSHRNHGNDDRHRRSRGARRLVCRGTAFERSHELAAYRVVYSDMFDSNKGGALAVDAHGGIIADKRIPGLRDAAAYSYEYEDGEFIAGGHRANTHLAADRGGEMRSFHLLGEPRYSGVMSIEPHDDGVAAVMNGNDSPEDDHISTCWFIANLDAKNHYLDGVSESGKDHEP